MSKSAIYPDLQELLVKPSDRLEFITKFWLISVTGDLVLTYLCYLSAPLIYTKENFLASTIGGLIIGGILGFFVGAINGVLQYILLRKYLIREWIIAVTIRTIFYSTQIVIVLLWYIHNTNFPTTESSFFDVNPIWLAISKILFPFLTISLFLVQGLLQWAVFKTYIKKINWWLFFPLITGYISGLQYLPIALILWFMLRRNLANVRQVFHYLLTLWGVSYIIFSPTARRVLYDSGNQILINLGTAISHLETWLVYGNFDTWIGFWFSWTMNIFTFAMMQAFAICCFRKQNPDSYLYLDSSSRFINTSDINGFFKTRSIINKLQEQINYIWKDELDSRFALSYWLSVQNDGSIIACHPINQVSQDNLEMTPLAQLINNPVSNISQTTAKLQVTFTSPSIVEIKSLLGMPFYLLCIINLSTVFVVNLTIMPILFSIILK